MSWGDEDPIETEIEELETVFRDFYGFEVDYWNIPDGNPAREATKKVIELMEDIEKSGCGPDTLVIFYYAGKEAPPMADLDRRYGPESSPARCWRQRTKF
ncbi:hypothetical protein B0T25DRAFT_571209 [Lasiosphaeria hispida]|uniref:Uncharacterized protein n=1 Tax=Lasiosphaeria hispida TaxID=260671 RepID=A0AAJ0HAK5_9PEZI|nr:hypothetical protein B0T25DRAFT_571209 [Lasiosphaeria hispida]